MTTHSGTDISGIDMATVEYYDMEREKHIFAHASACFREQSLSNEQENLALG
jgi:hypothetical protein